MTDTLRAWTGPGRLGDLDGVGLGTWMGSARGLGWGRLRDLDGSHLETGRLGWDIIIFAYGSPIHPAKGDQGILPTPRGRRNPPVMGEGKRNLV